MSAEYPNPCCRCGFCCLAETCPAGQMYHRIGKYTPCPSLRFTRGARWAVCDLVPLGLVPIGDGCCIKARAYKDGVEYDFASLPSDLKFQVTSSMRKL